MADARKFTDPTLAHDAEDPGEPTTHTGEAGGARRQHDERFRHDGDHREIGHPRFDFRGEDLLKLLDGLAQGTVLAGLPVKFRPPPVREAVGKILDQMGFPEDLLPAQAFNPKGRWKILVGCILAYTGLGIWQAIEQRKLALAYIAQQMAAHPAPKATADTEDQGGQVAGSGGGESDEAPVGNQVNGRDAPR